MISITTFCYLLVTWSAVINEYVNAIFYLHAFALPPSWTSKHVTWYLALWKATWIDIRFFFSVSLNISFCLVCFPLVRHMVASWWSVAEIFGWLLGCPKMRRFFFSFLFLFYIWMLQIGNYAFMPLSVFRYFSYISVLLSLFLCFLDCSFALLISSEQQGTRNN